MTNCVFVLQLMTSCVFRSTPKMWFQKRILEFTISSLYFTQKTPMHLSRRMKVVCVPLLREEQQLFHLTRKRISPFRRVFRITLYVNAVVIGPTVVSCSTPGHSHWKVTRFLKIDNWILYMRVASMFSKVLSRADIRRYNFRRLVEHILFSSAFDSTYKHWFLVPFFLNGRV